MSFGHKICLIPFRVAVAGCDVTTGGGAWLTGACARRVIVAGGGSTGLAAEYGAACTEKIWK